MITCEPKGHSSKEAVWVLRLGGEICNSLLFHSMSGILGFNTSRKEAKINFTTHLFVTNMYLRNKRHALIQLNVYVFYFNRVAWLRAGAVRSFRLSGLGVFVQKSHARWSNVSPSIHLGGHHKLQSPRRQVIRYCYSLFYSQVSQG